MVASTADGDTVEVATVGSEGFTAVTAILGSPKTRQQGALVKVVTLIPGSVLRLKAEIMEEAVDRNIELNRCTRRYLSVLFTQLVLSVSCNRLHSLEQRCARWLLALQDRAGARELRVTQHHLADMLGVARQSADRWLGELHEAGIIDRRRAVLTIGDRSRLLARTCDCYHAIAERLASIGTSRG